MESKKVEKVGKREHVSEKFAKKFKQKMKKSVTMSYCLCFLCDMNGISSCFVFGFLNSGLVILLLIITLKTVKLLANFFIL